jgi:S1-C subfamily serine protease
LAGLADEDVRVGPELRKAIEENGFKINQGKVRLLTSHDRQEVTGVIVNDKPNVRRRLLREVRAMLHAWEKWGLERADQEHARYYRKHRHPDKAKPQFDTVLRGKIAYIGMIRGKGDALYLRLRSKLTELDPSDTWRDVVSLPGKLKNSLWVLESEAAQGTGFALSGVGIVTCAHVLGRDLKAYRTDEPSKKYPVSIIASDEDSDLAIVEIAAKSYVELDADEEIIVRHGLPVCVAGFPLHHHRDEVYMHEGQVTQWRGAQQRFLVSADIVAGNSGGPVLSGEKVVGVAVTGSDMLENSEPPRRRYPFGVIPIRRIREVIPSVKKD